MKKLTAIVLCALMLLSALACSAGTLVKNLTEQAEQIGENLGEMGENLGENLGELGENLGENLGELGENLGEIGEELGENLGEIGEELGEGLSGLQIANPFKDYKTLEEAEQAAGFTLTLPAAYDGESIVQVMDGKMIQIIFPNENGGELCIRKQAGDEDISGDYNEYPEVKTVTVGGYTVTLKGADGKVNTAIWTADGYSYAVMFEVPVEKDVILMLIKEIA